MRRLRALRKRRRPRARTAQSLANRVARTFGFRAPLVRVTKCRKCAKVGWSGRYHPSTNTITQSEGAKMPKRLKPVLTGHEVGHGMTRKVYCQPKRTRSRLLRGVKRLGSRNCTYHGEHDARFYTTLEKIHRTNRVSPRAAVELEEASGYSPPRSWKRAAKRGRW